MIGLGSDNYNSAKRSVGVHNLHLVRSGQQLMMEGRHLHQTHDYNLDRGKYMYMRQKSRGKWIHVASLLNMYFAQLRCVMEGGIGSLEKGW